MAVATANAWRWATLGLWDGPSKPATYQDHGWTLDEFLGYIRSVNSSSGTVVNGDSILGIPEVYTAVNIVTSSFTALAVQVESSPAVERLLTDRFSSGMPADAGLTMMQSDLMLHNNAYAQIVPSTDGVSRFDLIPYPASSVQRRTPGEYRVTREGRQFSVPRNRMLHVMGHTRDGYTGISLVETLRNLWLASLLVSRYGRSYFEKGGQPSGIISLRAGANDMAIFVDQDDIDKAREAWNDQRQRGMAGTAFLPGPFAYQAISGNPEQSQFLGTNAWFLQRIAGAFNIPEAFLNHLENSTLANLQEMKEMYVQNCIKPYARRWASAIRFSFGVEVDWDFDELTRVNFLDRATGYESSLRAGWLLKSEVREREGLPPIQGIDDEPEPIQDVGETESDDDDTDDDDTD